LEKNQQGPVIAFDLAMKNLLYADTCKLHGLQQTHEVHGKEAPIAIRKPPLSLAGERFSEI